MTSDFPIALAVDAISHTPFPTSLPVPSLTSNPDSTSTPSTTTFASCFYKCDPFSIKFGKTELSNKTMIFFSNNPSIIGTDIGRHPDHLLIIFSASSTTAVQRTSKMIIISSKTHLIEPNMLILLHHIHASIPLKTEFCLILNDFLNVKLNGRKVTEMKGTITL